MAIGYKRFMELVEHWSNHGVAQMLGVAVSCTAIGVGVSMFLSPSSYTTAFAFDRVFHFASPFAWGTVYLISALAILATVFTAPRVAMMPLFILAATFVVEGLLIIPQTIAGAVSQSVFLCLGMAWTCIIAQLVCGVASKGMTNEKAIIHNKP